MEFPEFMVIVAAIGGVFGAGYYVGHRHATPVVTAASAAPSPMALPSALSVRAGGPVTPPKDFDKRQDEASARKNNALADCEANGDTPVFGFGYHVICVKREAVKWEFDPDFPPLSEGLK